MRDSAASNERKTMLLKGQCHNILDTFYKKKLHLDPIQTGKNGFAKVFVFAKIFAKNVCLHRQQLR